MILLVAVAIGLIAGWLRGGSIGRLADAPLSGRGLALAGALGAALPGTGLLPAALASPVLALALGAVVAVAWRNRTLPGVGLVALGTAANALAVLSNGAMPVTADALARAGLAGVAPAGRHALADAGTHLVWLGDVIGLGALGLVVSVGDLLLLSGLGVLVAGLMSGSPRRRGHHVAPEHPSAQQPASP